MKYFLFCLLLIGCIHNSESHPGPFDKSAPVPVIVARGTDGIMDYTCTVEDINDQVVWIPCKFYNNTSATANSCIVVTFYEESRAGVILPMKPVVESRRLCSGAVKPGDNGTNYVAFIKEKREALQRCGKLLDSCVMLASSR